MTDENGSIEDGEPGEQIEAFPTGLLEGDGRTLSQVVKGQVEVTASLVSVEVPVAKGSGLFDPNSSIYLTVTGELQKLVPTARRNEAGELIGWTVKQVVKPTFVQGAVGGSGAMEAEFAELVRQDPRLAGILLDRMQATLTDALAEA